MRVFSAVRVLFDGIRCLCWILDIAFPVGFGFGGSL